MTMYGIGAANVIFVLVYALYSVEFAAGWDLVYTQLVGAGVIVPHLGLVLVNRVQVFS